MKIIANECMQMTRSNNLAQDRGKVGAKQWHFPAKVQCLGAREMEWPMFRGEASQGFSNQGDAIHPSGVAAMQVCMQLPVYTFPKGLALGVSGLSNKARLQGGYPELLVNRAV